MPEQSLKLLVEYNRERLEEASICCGASDPQELPKEAAFVDLARTLAVHEQIVPHLLPMLANPVFDAAHKQMAFYLLLLGEQAVLQKQAFERHCEPDEPPFDLLPALALLEHDKQQQALAQLAELKSRSASQLLARHFLVNPGKEAYIPLFADEWGDARFEGDLFDQFSAHTGTPQTQQGLVARFNTATSANKLALANALLSTPFYSDALAWLYSAEGLVNDRCLTFALLSGPRAYHQLDALAGLPLTETILLEIADNLKWYGNPRSIHFLRWGMQHKNTKVQQPFHRLLMAFFDEDDEALFEGVLLLEEDAPAQADYSAKLQKFWDGKAGYIEQHLDSHRYFQSDIFNIKNLFEAYTGTKSIYQLEDHAPFSRFVAYLQMWTGQQFYYDGNALLSKQRQQVKQIKAWLEANPFEQGRWLCLGGYVD